MPKFHFRNFPPPDIKRHPNWSDAAIATEARNYIYLAFKSHIEKPVGLGLMLHIPNESNPKVVTLESVNGTAMIARWMRGAYTEAITLVLSDIDDSNDEAAMTTVQEELIKPNGEELRPLIESLIDDVRHQPRPLCATIHMDEHSYDSFVNHACAGCLTSAFCDHHGISDE